MNKKKDNVLMDAIINLKIAILLMEDKYFSFLILENKNFKNPFLYFFLIFFILKVIYLFFFFEKIFKNFKNNKRRFFFWSLLTYYILIKLKIKKKNKDS